MANQFRRLIVGSIVFVALSHSSIARADTPAPPFSYKQNAAGGKYVFVMVAPDPVESVVLHWNKETAYGIREIRRIYTRSGLYRNDGTTEPLWTVDWYAYGVVIALDGIHLIRHGPWPRLPKDRNASLSTVLDTEAVSFFANGQLIRMYTISELVDDADKLPRTASHFRWWDEPGHFNNAKMEYSLTTYDANTYVIDVNPGSIISETRPVQGRRWYWLAGIALGVIAIAAIVGESLRLRAREMIENTQPQKNLDQ